MSRKLEPCPFCGVVEKETYTEHSEGCYIRKLCDLVYEPDSTSEATHGDEAMRSAYNTRYKRTCHWSPLVPDPENPAESHYEYEGNWKTECGEAYVWDDECWPNYCPNCSGVVSRGAEVADGD